MLPLSRRFVTQLLNSLPTSSQIPADARASGANPLSSLPDSARKQLLSLQVLFPNEFVPALDLLDRNLVTRLHICDGLQLTTPVVELKPGLTQSHTEPSAEQSERRNDHHIMPSDIVATKMPTAEQSHHVAASCAQSALSVATEDQNMTDAAIQENNSTTQELMHEKHDTVYYVRSAQQRSSRYSTSYDTAISYEVRLKAWNCSCPAFAFAAFPALPSEPPVVACGSTEMEESQPGRMEVDNPSAEWLFGGLSLGNDMPPVCKHLLACVLVEKCKGIFGNFVEERNVGVEEAAGWAAGWGD